jgi:hypothetical protein
MKILTALKVIDFNKATTTATIDSCQQHDDNGTSETTN